MGLRRRRWASKGRQRLRNGGLHGGAAELPGGDALVDCGRSALTVDSLQRAIGQLTGLAVEDNAPLGKPENAVAIGAREAGLASNQRKGKSA